MFEEEQLSDALSSWTFRISKHDLHCSAVPWCACELGGREGLTEIPQKCRIFYHTVIPASFCFICPREARFNVPKRHGHPLLGLVKAEVLPPLPRWWGRWRLLLPDWQSLLPAACLRCPRPKPGLGNAVCRSGPALALILICWTFKPVETSWRIYLSAKPCSTSSSSLKGISRSRILESSQTKCPGQLLFAIVTWGGIMFSVDKTVVPEKIPTSTKPACWKVYYLRLLIIYQVFYILWEVGREVTTGSVFLVYFPLKISIFSWNCPEAVSSFFFF